MEEKNKEEDIIYIYSENQEEDRERVETRFENSDDRPIEDNSVTDDPDNSATNFAHYTESDINSAKEKAEENSRNKGGVSVFGLLLKTMFNPVEGWKSIRRHKIKPETAQKECLYPLLAVYAVSMFAILAYSAKADLSDVVVNAVTSFVSFFFGYFCIVIALRHILPGPVAELFDADFGKTLVVISLSSLCLFFTLTELLPMLWAILIFLPLWTVYMICRATKFMKIPEDRQLLTVGLLNLTIIGTPIVLQWALGKIMPN